MNPVFPTITRTVTYIDGYTKLSVDFYPQTATSVDLSSGSSSALTFLPPRFKDDEEGDLGLAMADPERQLYFKVRHD